MTFTVWYRKKNDFGMDAIVRGHFFSANQNLPKRRVSLALGFEKVAEIVADSIDNVFERTNTFGEAAWWKNEGVIHFGGSMRSMCVGDIIEDEENRIFLILPIGMEEVQRG